MIIALMVNSIAFRLPNMLHVTRIRVGKLASSNDAIAIMDASMMTYDEQMKKGRFPLRHGGQPEIEHGSDTYSWFLNVNVRCT